MAQGNLESQNTVEYRIIIWSPARGRNESREGEKTAFSYSSHHSNGDMDIHSPLLASSDKSTSDPWLARKSLQAHGWSFVTDWKTRRLSSSFYGTGHPGESKWEATDSNQLAIVQQVLADRLVWGISVVCYASTDGGMYAMGKSKYVVIFIILILRMMRMFFTLRTRVESIL